MTQSPDNTPGIGCCGLRTCSNIESKTIDDCKSMAAKNELDTYKKTLWCIACYYCFSGLTYDMSPWCQQEGKLCCFMDHSWKLFARLSITELEDAARIMVL